MARTALSEANGSILLATFHARETLCGIDAAGIQEIIRLGKVTEVRDAAEAIVGIVNLRGKIVTILDLGMRLGMPKLVPGADCRVLIVDDRGEFVGLLVDAVEEVIEVDGSTKEQPPANTSSTQARYFSGVCRAGKRVIALLDVRQVLSDTVQ
jgi:purine-binding chemotaxis protein CheW